MDTTSTTKTFRHLVTCDIELGSVVQTARYDGMGRRVVREVKNSGELNVAKHYFYAGQSVVEVRTANGDAIKHKTWAGAFGVGYVDELLQVGHVSDPLVGEIDTMHYALHDANYNVVALVDEDAELVERYEYTPYGERQVYFSAGDNDPLAMSPTSMSRRWTESAGIPLPYSTLSVGHQGLMHDEHLGGAGGRIHNRARTLPQNQQSLDFNHELSFQETYDVEFTVW